MSKLGLGAALAAIFSIIIKILKIIAEVLAKIIYYLGLWAPLLYLAYGGILILSFKDFSMFGLDTNSIIYLVGFLLTIVISIIITIKNLIIRPFKKIFKRKDVIEYGKNDDVKLKTGTPEAPKIYNSRVNHGVIVYEYKDRYDLYEQKDDHLILVSTEIKKRKKKHADRY